MERIGKVELAEALARYAHQGQVDHAGKPYFYHPATVASWVDTPEEKTVAYLHDVLEDTFVTAETLRNLFGDNIANAVEALTRRDGENYEDYVVRAGENPLARRVKLADLAHNMDLSRLPVIREKDRQRFQRYNAAVAYLKGLEHDSEKDGNR